MIWGMSCLLLGVAIYFRTAEEVKAKANEQYKGGHYNEAVRLYSEAIGKYYPWRWKGDDDGLFTHAINRRSILELSPNTATYYANRAAALTMLGKYKEAAEDCRTATNLDPSNIKAFCRAGKCHMNLGNLEESTRQYELALQVDQSNAQAQREYNNLLGLKNYIAQMDMYMQNKQWGLAGNSLDRAISMVDADRVPFKWEVWRAECALNQKKWSEASRIVKWVFVYTYLFAVNAYSYMLSTSYLVRLDTQNPDVLYLRARVFYGQGDNAKTMAHCMEALRCDPDFAKARVLLKKARALDSHKEKGNTAFKTNQLQEAFDSYSAALEIDPENDALNAKLYSNRAAVLQKVCVWVYYPWTWADMYKSYSSRNSKKLWKTATKPLNWILTLTRYIAGELPVIWNWKNTRKLFGIIVVWRRWMPAIEVCVPFWRCPFKQRD